MVAIVMPWVRRSQTGTHCMCAASENAEVAHEDTTSNWAAVTVGLLLQNIQGRLWLQCCSPRSSQVLSTVFQQGS